MPTLKSRLADVIRRPFVPVTLAWLALATLLVMRAWNLDFLSLLTDTDDATRLVVVRDFLGGQNWFDHVQHRFNTPYGAVLHWSRLIDLPLGGLITLFNSVVPGQGERVALFVWPLVWLWPALWLTLKLTRRLLGDGHDFVALVLAALSVSVFSEFSPGRIDHHNVQMVLVLWLALETLDARRTTRAAWLAGIAAATSQAIGAETLPVIAAAISAFGLYFVFDKGFAPHLWRFGVSFALATLGHFLIAIGPSDWLVPHCDALSMVFVVAGFGVALVFGVLTVLPIPEKARFMRFGLGLAGAALIGVVLLEMFPGCAAGPYAMLDPFLREAWLANIVESRPLWTSLAGLPAYTLAVSVPVFLAFGGGIHRLATTTGDKRGDWAAYMLVLIAGMASMILQMRGVRIAALLAIPGAVALIATLRNRYLAASGGKRLRDGLALLAGWAGSAGVFVFLVVGLAFPPESNEAGASPLQACLTEQAFEPLARLSPARIAAPVDFGPYILLLTPHAVIGSPYHRNTEGIADSLRIFGASEEAAWRAVTRRGIDLVVWCEEMLAVTGNGFDAENSLKSLFAVGGHPDWLTPIPVPEGAVRVYRVAR